MWTHMDSSSCQRRTSYMEDDKKFPSWSWSGWEGPVHVSNKLLCPIFRAPYFTGHEDETCSQLAPGSCSSKEIQANSLQWTPPYISIDIPPTARYSDKGSHFTPDQILAYEIEDIHVYDGPRSYILSIMKIDPPARKPFTINLSPPYVPPRRRECRLVPIDSTNNPTYHNPTIQFKTAVVNASHFQKSESYRFENLETLFPLINGDGNLCGRIQMDSFQNLNHSTTSYEFALISSVGYGPLGPIFIYSRSMSCGLDSDGWRREPQDIYECLNVMLIVWKGDFAERLAVGHIVEFEIGFSSDSQ
jgi:hypothetical protein